MVTSTKRRLLSTRFGRPEAVQEMRATLESWDNEGGSPVADIALVGPDLERLTLADRRPEDTAAGCRERAAADLNRAAAGGYGRGRWLFESSAARWSDRAEMLASLEARHDR